MAWICNCYNADMVYYEEDGYSVCDNCGGRE